jgi:hypothetical protein
MDKIGQITYSSNTYRNKWGEYIQQKYAPRKLADYIQQHYVLRKLGTLHTPALNTEKIEQITQSRIRY